MHVLCTVSKQASMVYQILAMLRKHADQASVNSQVATLPLSTSTKNKD